MAEGLKDNLDYAIEKLKDEIMKMQRRKDNLEKRKKSYEIDSYFFDAKYRSMKRGGYI